MLDCSLAKICSACPWIKTSPFEQKKYKIQALSEALSNYGLDLPSATKFISIAESGLRDRVDLSIHMQNKHRHIGFYNHDKTQIVDIDYCPQMTPKLQECYALFRKRLPNIDLGAVRLRVSPSGEFGAWFDFPNKTIKFLLEDKKSLELLYDDFYIEVGQRRKTLVLEKNNFSLQYLKPKIWFQTYVGDSLTPVDLHLQVGSFSQVGFAANKVLCRELIELLKKVPTEDVLEVCCGIGNFSLPIASVSEKLTVIENDKRALEALEMNLEKTKISNLKIWAENIYSAKFLEGIKANEFSTVVVDPPRSGLRDFLPTLLNASNKLQSFIYISCFAPSFAKDAGELKKFGFQLKEIKLIDQFPQSPHCEYMALFQR